MGTIVFVHGTGVRRAAYNRTLELFTKKSATYLPNSTIVGIPWGEMLGARLNQNGDSIPEYADLRGQATRSMASASAARWELLSHNPLIELLILPPESFIGECPGEWLWRQIPKVSRDPRVSSLLGEWDLTPEFESFLNEICGDPDWQKTIRSISQQQMAERVGRAMTAQFLASMRIWGLPGLSGLQRDQLASALVAPLGGEALGVTDWVLTGLTHVARRRRSTFTDSSNPVVGDILRYQARGGEMRNLIAESLKPLNPPVALVAHSLGGVACVDMLANEVFPAVTHLVTVGSQAPHFYELDALSSRRFGLGLPSRFPLWLNIFDPNDFLAFCGARIFPGCVEDLEVDNGQPFPDSHSAYWNNDSQVWVALARFLNN